VKKRKAKPRGYISFERRLAAALCHLLRPTGDPARPLERIISHDEAKKMTPRQIIARFELAHNVPHAIGGSIHPANLEYKPKAQHRHETRTKDVPQIAKGKRLEKEQEDFRRRMLAKAGQGKAPPKKPKGRPMPGSRASGIRKRMSGKVETWR
jgi:hypothetical protein